MKFHVKLHVFEQADLKVCTRSLETKYLNIIASHYTIISSNQKNVFKVIARILMNRYSFTDKVNIRIKTTSDTLTKYKKRKVLRFYFRLLLKKAYIASPLPFSLFLGEISLHTIYTQVFTSPRPTWTWKFVNGEGARHPLLASPAGVKHSSIVGITAKVENNKLVDRF